MITIPIQVSGDIWANRKQVKEILDQTHPGQQVMLDLCSEGPSLRYLGIVDLIEPYNLDVSVTRWSNGVEQVSYNRVFCNKNSHFFPLSRHYWKHEIPNIVPTEFRFGLFQGRGCPSRNRILHDAATVWTGKFLLSKMSSSAGDIWGERLSPDATRFESTADWFDDIEYARAWFKNCSITSIDNHAIQDQYREPEISAAEVAHSLLEHYHRFNIELVCETYTLGDTFFPTEKTARPIVGDRPFIVYGPKHYLNNLQQQGFRTFANIWDESYDQLEGVARWQAMSELITTLANMPSHVFQDTIDRARGITQHNKIVLGKNISDFKKL